MSAHTLHLRTKHVDRSEVKITVSCSTSGCNIFVRVADDGRLIVDVDRPDGVVELRRHPQVKLDVPR